MTENALRRSCYFLELWPYWKPFKSAMHVLHGLFPWTWVSLAFLSMAYYLWYWEVSPHANQILFSAVGWGLAVFAFLSAMTILAALLVFFLTWRKNIKTYEAENYEVGAQIASAYRVYHPLYLPFISVRVQLLDEGFVRKELERGLWLCERLEIKERGRHQRLRRRVTVEDIFGFVRLSWVFWEAVDWTIKPAEAKLAGFILNMTASGEGYSHPEGESKGELVEMRRYQAGDPLRLVLWKVFARSRKLLVRAPEPAIVEQNEMFVYFISGVGDEPSASMARAFLASMDLNETEVLFGADGATSLSRNSAEALEDVIESVRHREHGGADLGRMAKQVSAAMRQHSFIMVPALAGPWLKEVETFVANYRLRPTFIMSLNHTAEQAQEQPAPSRWKRLFFKQAAQQGGQAAQRALCEHLSRLGELRLVDVHSGHAINYASQSAWRQ